MPGSSLSSLQGKTRVFSQSSDSYFLKKLTLSFYDPTSGTQFEMRGGDDSLRGYNLARQYNGPSTLDIIGHFAEALFGTAVLLGSVATAQPEGVAAGAGLIAAGVSVSWTWVDSINSLVQLQMNDSAIDVYGYNNGSNSVYNVGSAVGWARDRVCDATLSLMVHWILGSPTRTGNQTTVIKATATYFPETTSNYAVGSDINVTTTVTLNIGPDNNNDMAHATGISTFPTAVFDRQYIGKYDTDDFFSFEAEAKPSASINVTVVANESYSDYPDLHLALYDPTGTNRINSSSGFSSTLLYTVTDHSGLWYVDVHCDGDYGFYTLWFDEEYPFGGGCPYVCSWNGTQYVADNNLLPKSETSNGSDVQDYYRLEQSLVPSYSNPLFSIYSVQISEFEHEHSSIDQVKLYSVGHNPNTNVAVSPTGQMLTYQDPRPPIFAEDQSGRDWLQTLSSVDGNYYQSAPNDYLTLCFGQVNSLNAKLVLREDLMKDSIHVQLLTTNGLWTEVSDIPGRVNWATDIVNLSPLLQTAWNPLTVRLYFTAYHRIDYVGLDTTPQAKSKQVKPHWFPRSALQMATCYRS